ncbi:hypothetical protein [Methanofollis fontis]|uniref:DUF7982 domain-containing protein n=1 Tax=Methanofollis fontis TaxID=2052832 RepID=A0A483CV14_9EURY|nr:hypothetical protein [Methanofollis fontis]TAJ45311.1 hypothetical protein CUJ86_00760 [Methanofollis fontis]
MKLSGTNDTTRAALLLLGAAAAALILAALTGRGDLTSATLVLAGFGSFIAGVFLLTLSKDEPMDPEIAALLPVGGTVDVATLIADLGVQGDAQFLPPREDGSAMQVIPVSGRVPTDIPEGTSYITGIEGDAVVIRPLCAPLLSYLKNYCSFEVPSDPDRLCEAIAEVCADALEIADSVAASFDGENLVVDLKGFSLGAGCAAVRAASPRCCTMVGCPVCSLVACIMAEGTGRPARIASASPAGSDLHIIIEPAA